MSNRPKPTAVKLAEGNRGHRPIEGDDFQPEHIMPETPKGMSRGALREWRRMSKVLFNSGVLTQVDGKALRTYCEKADLVERAQKRILETGTEVISVYAMNKEGEQVFLRQEINPWYKVLADAEKIMKAFLIEFGLTPASRSRLKLPKKPEDDEIDKLLGKGKGKSVPGFTQPTRPAQPGTEAVNKSGMPEVLNVDANKT